LGQGGFELVAQIDVNPGGCVSFLSHLRGTLPGGRGRDKR
jgi:hypothetical protein